MSEDHRAGRRLYDSDFIERLAVLENKVFNLEEAFEIQKGSFSSMNGKLDNIDKKLDRYGWFGAGMAFLAASMWGCVAFFKDQIFHLLK